MDPRYIEEPNKVYEMYRNHCPLEIVSHHIENCLDFIEIAEDGCAILGSSDLCGRYWRGSVLFFKDPTHATKKTDYLTGIECNASVCDGKFIEGSKTFIVGDDLGSITLYESVEPIDESVQFEPRHSRHDHDSCVLSISVSPSKTNVVSGGMDKCIKVWDIEGLVSIHTFCSAHSHHVTSVAYSPLPESGICSNCFVSCGLDGAALIWDTRQPKPATVLKEDQNEGLTSLAWQNGDENSLFLGSAFGNLSLVDIRACATVKSSSAFNRSIYKIVSVNQKLLAICADTNEVKCVDPTTDNFIVKYVDERHTDFVRGLAYDKKKNVLFSCGWDHQVLEHIL